MYKKKILDLESLLLKFNKKKKLKDKNLKMKRLLKELWKRKGLGNIERIWQSNTQKKKKKL